MWSLLAKFRTDEAGATAIEYGLILAILGLSLISALTMIKGELGILFNAVIIGLQG